MQIDNGQSILTHLSVGILLYTFTEFNFATLVLWRLSLYYKLEKQSLLLLHKKNLGGNHTAKLKIIDRSIGLILQLAGLAG